MVCKFYCQNHVYKSAIYGYLSYLGALPPLHLEFSYEKEQKNLAADFEITSTLPLATTGAVWCYR